MMTGLLYGVCVSGRRHVDVGVASSASSDSTAVEAVAAAARDGAALDSATAAGWAPEDFEALGSAVVSVLRRT
jgi:hypothetical protein